MTTVGIVAVAGDFPPTKAKTTRIYAESIIVSERWTETGSALTVSAMGNDFKMYNWYSDEGVWKLWKTIPATTTPVVATSTVSTSTAVN